MPAFADITVNNYAAAAVTYKMEDVLQGVAKWNDISQGTPAGFRSITLQIRRSTDRSNGVDRVLVKLARPTVNVTTGAVDLTGRVNTEAIVPVRMTLAERQELWAAHKNFAAHTNCQKAMVDLEGTN
jgi:hypothetical protein